LIEPSKAESNSPREDEMETFKKQVHTGRPSVLGLVGMSMTILSLGVTAGCTKESAAKSEPARSTVAAGADSTSVLATVGDEKITMADVRNRAGVELDQLETQYQLAKSRIVRTALDSILLDKTINAEAKRSGKSVDELIAAEAGSEGLTPTDAQVAAWYQANPNRTSGRSLEQLRPNIVELLRAERRRDAAHKLQARLSAERKVNVAYDPYRLQFDNAKAPSLGKSDAPVTLVEFSDFQCPFCQGAVPTIKQVEKKYGDKVRIVYRQFPLPNLHPFAIKAAEASLCANEQSKFWEMHDAMFADQKKLAVSDLKQTARSLGMDGKKFDACMDTGRYAEQVQNDQKEGQRAGVTGTPAIYLNGTPVDGGSVPFSVLEAAIEKELARAKPGA
jgi:protein-disulfide isomerase